MHSHKILCSRASKSHLQLGYEIHIHIPNCRHHGCMAPAKRIVHQYLVALSNTITTPAPPLVLQSLVWVYQGYKVMPFSTACGTPLSNFEAGLNYKDVRDPTVVIHFPIIGEEDARLLAWTTTPWTLPSNIALCVHKKLKYVIKIPRKKEWKQICHGQDSHVSALPRHE